MNKQIFLIAATLLLHSGLVKLTNDNLGSALIALALISFGGFLDSYYDQ